MRYKLFVRIDLRNSSIKFREKPQFIFEICALTNLRDLAIFLNHDVFVGVSFFSVRYLITIKYKHRKHFSYLTDDIN